MFLMTAYKGYLKMPSIFERVLDKGEALERLEAQFEKGRPAAIGEVRERKDGRWRKTTQGWVPAEPGDKLRVRTSPGTQEKFKWDGNLTGLEEYGSPKFEEDLNIYTDSNIQYKDSDGNYKPERIEKVHKPIVDSYVKRGKKNPEGGKPTAILMMGAPATGKGFLRRLLMGSGEIPRHFVTVDPDDIKTKGLKPDYDRFSEDNNKTAALFVHEEGSDISKEVFLAMEEHGFDYIQDKVFASFPKLKKEIKRLNEKGYNVQVIATKCPKSLAWKRMLKRASGPEARFVHPKAFNDAHNAIDGAFEALMQAMPEGLLSVKRYDTERQGLKLIDSKP